MFSILSPGGIVYLLQFVHAKLFTLSKVLSGTPQKSMSNVKKESDLQWVFFAISNVAVIGKMAYALPLLLGTTVKNSKQFCTALEKLLHTMYYKVPMFM